MKFFIGSVFILAVVFACNWIINKFYEKELEHVPNCEAAEEVYDRKNEEKINLLWVVLICIMIADKYII